MLGHTAFASQQPRSHSTLERQLHVKPATSLFNPIENCQKQYVEEAKNPLHLWMNGQCSEYHHRLPDKPVAVHFNSPNHTFNDVSVMIIEHIGMAGPLEQSIRRAIGFLVYDCWPHMGST